jgi:hypothetical protein
VIQAIGIVFECIVVLRWFCAATWDLCVTLIEAAWSTRGKPHNPAAGWPQHKRGDVTLHTRPSANAEKLGANKFTPVVVVAVFPDLAAKWRKETGLLSSVQDKIYNRHYQRVIGLGRDALPFIFRDLRLHGGLWFWALECITGDNPASASNSITEAKTAWLDYGSRNGYFYESGFSSGAGSQDADDLIWEAANPIRSSMPERKDHDRQTL